MSYQKAKGRSKGRFVLVRHDIIKSEAWRSLSTNARCVWLEIMFRYNGNNNGEIPLGCREAGKLCKVSKNTAWKAFNELQDRGFVKIGLYSNFTCKYKRSTRWIVTHEAFDGKGPTNEWRVVCLNTESVDNKI